MNNLVDYDKTLFLFLNSLGSEPWDGFWLLITDKLASIPLYAVLLFLCFKKFGLKSTLITVVLVSIMIAATDQLANAFKYGIERLRPCHDDTIINSMRLVKSHCGGKFGFFSAHAANAFALATFFSLLFSDYSKKLALLLTFWALLVAYSRIYIGVHYPLDVVAGISIGMLAGWLFYMIKTKIERF